MNTACSKTTNTSSEYRSVLQYEGVEAVTKALRSSSVSDNESSTARETAGSGSSSSSSSWSGDQNDDWVLRNRDIETSFASSVEHEAQRLTVLKSYKVLESEREPAVDRVTSEVRQRFNGQWAVVSLVDLGRQWFMSINNKEDDIGCRETSRGDSFCAHTVQSRQGILVVPDARSDDRFRESPLVVGSPGIRFYAGVALVSPEGYNLGTLCVVDTKPRPDGISQQEEEYLRARAKEVMRMLVDRRTEMDLRDRQHATVHIAASDSGNKRDLSPMSCQAIFCDDLAKKLRQEVQAPPSSNDDANPASDYGIISKPLLAMNRPLPDPKVAGVHPDAYLCDLVESMYGVSLKITPALDLNDFFAVISEEQMTAYNMDIVSATRVNDVAKLQEYYQAYGRDCLDCFNRFGEGLLTTACRRGFKEMVKFLLSDEVKLTVRVRDDYGRTPMHDSCWNPQPQLEICAWIMDQDPSLFLISDKRGFTPFQYARKGDWHIWRQFLFDNRELLEPLTHPDVLSRFTSAC